MDQKRDAKTPLQPASRRDVLHTTACLTAAVGLGGAAWPLLGSLQPAADVKVPDYVDLTGIAEGNRVVALVRGIGSVLIAHRTPEEIAAARADDGRDLPDPALDRERTSQEAWLVVLSWCTYRSFPLTGVDRAPKSYWLGSSWLERQADDRGLWGGFFCQQCGSHFDTAGRARKGLARRNLVVPRYRFADSGTLEFDWWAA